MKKKSTKFVDYSLYTQYIHPGMKRGLITKSSATMVNLLVPEDWLPRIEQAVRMLDTDRSKFIRTAIREKLAKAGVEIPLEVAP